MAEAGGTGALPALGRHAPPGRHGAAAGAAGLTIRERWGAEMVSLAVRRGRDAALAEVVREAFEAELPPAPRFVHGADGTGFAWAGAGQWMAEAPRERGLEERLRRAASGLAALAAQGDGRVVLEVGGSAVREVLARLVPVDLHPAAFRTDDVAHTLAGQVGARVRLLPDGSFELVAFRSFARSLFDAVLEAGLPAGVEVLPPRAV